MSEISNLSISEKFEKELVTFMLWISDSDYKISKTRDSVELDWSIDLLSSFEEPGRNKLECFIKELKKMYFISYNEEEINDIKSITKNFRENKSEISKDIKVKKSNGKVKKVLDEVHQVVEEVDKVVHQVVEEVDKVVDKVVDEVDKVVDEVDVNVTVNDVYKLDLKTDILVEVLGMPKYYRNEYIKYKWDIKCEKTNKLFMIYNWVNKDGLFEVFEKTQWYLVEVIDGSYFSSSYMDFMRFFNDKKDIKEDKFEGIDMLNPYKNKSVKNEITRKVIEDETCENLEIDLDDIEF